MRRRRTTGDPAVAVAYLRASTDEQANGLAGQHDQVEAFAVRQGWRIASWHTDEGVSGSVMPLSRAGLTEALESISEVGAGVLLVARLDRLARDVEGAVLVEVLVRERGATIASAAGEGTDGDDPGSLLRRRIHTVFAEHELHVIRARIRAALQARRKRLQKYTHLPPYGWRYEAGVMVPHEAERALIEYVRKLRNEYVASLREIVAVLTAEGKFNRYGRPFTLRGVRRLLDAKCD